MRTTLHILLRAGVLIGLDALVVVLLDRFDDSTDANIGAGLLLFALIAAIAVVWGLLDGLRWRYGRVLVTWGVTAVLYGLAAPFLIALAAGEYDGAVVRSDLAEVTPFMIGLVAVPALIAGGLAQLSRRDR